MEFTEKVPHPDPDPEPDPTKVSGDIFKGTLTVKWKSCKNKTKEEIKQVTSGGYLKPPSDLKPGDDTSPQPGNYEVSTTSLDDPQLDGFRITDPTADTQRGIFIHSMVRDLGSSGCLSLGPDDPDKDPPEEKDKDEKIPSFVKFETAVELMKNEKCVCRNKRKNKVPLEVTYAEACGPPKTAAEKEAEKEAAEEATGEGG